MLTAADFSTTEKRRRECARGRAQSARVSGSDDATGRATCVPWVSGHADACTHVGAGRWARPIFRPPRNGGGSVPVAAHSLRECRGAMVRRGGPLAYRGYPVTPMLAHMLARGGGRGRFFDHRETAAGVCPWPRTVCESVGRRRRDGAGSDLSRWCGFPLVWRMSISRLANSWREGLPEMCRP